MDMNKKIIVGIVVCFFATSFANAQQSFTLQSAIELAIKNNYTVQQTQLQQEAAAVNWNQAKMNLLPDLNANISHGINKGRSIDPFTNQYVDQEFNYANWGLNSNLLLFNGFSNYNQIKQRRLGYEASTNDVQQQKEATALRVITAYLTVLASEDLMTIAKNRVEATSKQVERLEEMNKEGAIVPATLYDLKGTLATDQLSLVNSTNAMNSAKITLCQLLLIPYDKNLQLDRSGLEQLPAEFAMGPEELYQAALKNLALVKGAKLRTESANAAVKAAKGQYYPTLGFGVGIGSNYSSISYRQIPGSFSEQSTGDYVKIPGSGQYDVLTQSQSFTQEKIRYFDQIKNNRSTGYSLGLQIPIFNNFFVRNQVKLAKIQQKSVEIDQKNTLTQLQQDVEQASFNATASYESYKASANQVSAFSESFRSAEVRFNAGVINSVDYLVSKTQLDQANINLTRARYEYIFRIKVLDYYSGKPLW